MGGCQGVKVIIARTSPALRNIQECYYLGLQMWERCQMPASPGTARCLMMYLADTETTRLIYYAGLTILRLATNYSLSRTILT